MDFNEKKQQERPLLGITDSLRFLKHAEILWQANFCLDDLLELAKNFERPVFPIILGCVETLATNTEQSHEIRTSIITKVVEDFFPLLNDIGIDEMISEEEITEVSNNLGKIEIMYENDDTIAKPYKIAFMETVSLRERNSILNF